MARSGLAGIGHLPFEKDNYWAECVDTLGYKPLTKKEVFRRIGYRPLPTMEKMHRSRATHRIIVGGNRSGKTYAAMAEIIPYLFFMKTNGWIVSKNYDMASELEHKIEDILIERLGMEKILRPDALEPWQFAYGQKAHDFLMGTGSRFQLKSSESPDSMHAVPLDWIVVDEAALLPYIIYDTRLVPRLIDSGGWILSIGTLEWLTGEWFEQYFDIGQSSNELGIESWEHPTEDNFHVYYALGGETPETVAADYHSNWRKIIEDNPELEWPLKAGEKVIIYNIDINWLHEQKARVAPEIYAARYEAKLSTSPYIVFPSFSVEKHVSASKTKFDFNLPVYIAVDPGGTYAVNAVQFKRFPDTGHENKLTKGLSLCVIDEVYFQTTITTQEVYNVCSSRPWWDNVARWPWPWMDQVQGTIDVTQKEQKRAWEILAQKDPRIRKLVFKIKKVMETPGIQTLQYYLDTGSFFVNPKCIFTILEMKRWTYPTPSIAGLGDEDPRKSDKPKDAWNHAVKDLIYLIVNLFGYYEQPEEGAILSRREVVSRIKDRRALLDSVVARF